MIIDLRSDTVTRPSPGMKEAMMEAKVGDDVWGDDPTVNKLQEVAAAMFGKEAGLFCPSGTMTNQIAIKVHTQPGDELLCADTSHIYWYEGGGIAFNSGVQVKLLPSHKGIITASQVRDSLNPDDQHFPRTSLVCLENTTNKGGGAVYPLATIQEISDVCKENGLPLHLDGARVFNAIVEGGYSALDIGVLFDSVSVCLSKGLGCPVGSVLLGSAAFIAKARRIRKVLGGGMRQAGFLAAAGLYALQHNIQRLSEDHALAKYLASQLSTLPFVSHVLPVQTNIVIFEVRDGLQPSKVVDVFQAHGVLISTMSARLLRLVTHLDVTAEMGGQLEGRLREVSAELMGSC